MLVYLISNMAYFSAEFCYFYLCQECYVSGVVCFSFSVFVSRISEIILAPIFMKLGGVV